MCILCFVSTLSFNKMAESNVHNTNDLEHQLFQIVQSNDEMKIKLRNEIEELQKTRTEIRRINNELPSNPALSFTNATLIEHMKHQIETQLDVHRRLEEIGLHIKDEEHHMEKFVNASNMTLVKLKTINDALDEEIAANVETVSDGETFELDNEIQVLDERISSAKKELKSLTQECADTEAAVEQSNESLSEMDKIYAETSVELEQLLDDGKHNDDTYLLSLEEEINKETNEVNEAEKILVELQNQMEQQNSFNAKLNERILELQKCLFVTKTFCEINEFHHESSNDISNELNIMQSENVLKQKVLQELDEEIQTAEKEKAIITSELSESKKTCESLCPSIDDLKIKLRETDELSIALLKRNQDIKYAVRMLERENQQLEENSKILKEGLMDPEANIQDLEERQAALIEEIREKTRMIETNEEKLKEAIRRSDELDELISEAKMKRNENSDI